MKQQLKRLPGVLLGNALLAFGICAFVAPHGFMVGGVNGIALALQNVVNLPLSVLTAIMNILLFLLGLIFMGRAFAATTLLSTLIYPAFVAVFEQLPLAQLFTADTLTCAIFAAVCCGLGVGTVIRMGGATGGMDIPPCILQKYKGVPVAYSIMALDVLVVLMQVLLQGTEGLLHSLIIIFLMSTMVGKTSISGAQKVEVIIISAQHDAIRKYILEELDSGVTMLDIETGYDGVRQKAVLSVVYAKKYAAIRDAALKIDPMAFIVASDVKNVNGVGYTIDRAHK